MVYTTYPPPAHYHHSSQSSLTPLTFPHDSTTYLARITSANSVSPRNTLISKGIHRSRFCLRLLSATFAGALLGALSLALKQWRQTKEGFLLYEGRQIWPERLDMVPSDLFFVLAGVFLGTSSALVLASLWPKVRHLTKTGNFLALAVALVNLAISLTAVVYLYTYKPAAGTWTFWKWTCDNADVNHPDIRFSLVCSEIRFAWAMGVAVVVSEFLSLANFVAAVYVVRRNSKLARTGSFFEKS